MKRGFSLVEISIVLVILGLLVGGVLSGQSLIRAAELRSVSADYNRYFSAVQTFRDKYFALPGDMTNATSFWGAEDTAAGNGDGLGTNCDTVISSSALTCNGNGDGMIGRGSPQYYEALRFWQHLANAGLIEGSFTGVGVGATWGAKPGVNAPKSKISNAGFSTLVFNGSAILFINNSALVNRNLMYFGGERVGNSSNPIITPAEAWNIDTKNDDGIPGTGRVLNYRSDYTVTPNCTTATDSTARYNLSSSDTLCSVVFDYAS
jgi:prepilin-type N-terminal cleavage/methylation domain-containing protein